MVWESEGYWRCTPARGGSPGSCSSLGAGDRQEALHIGHWHSWDGHWVTSVSGLQPPCAATPAGLSEAPGSALALHCPEVWSSLFSHLAKPWLQAPMENGALLFRESCQYVRSQRSSRRAALAAATHRRENPVFHPAEPSQPMWLMRAACCCALQGQD